MTKKTFIKQYGMAVAMAGMIFLAAGCGAPKDVNFARSVMNDLIAGRYSARHHIDWENFVVAETDIGATYKAYSTDKDKKDYACAFIDKFSKGFKAQGATEDSLVKWRIFNDADPKVIYVAADNASGAATFIFYVHHDKGKLKLLGIRVVAVQDRDKYTAFEQEQRHVVQP